jgi:hypothetical protein
MLVLLSLVGYLVLRRGWSAGVIGLVGVVLWLVVMLVVMPPTTAGIFAKGLLEGHWAVLALAHLRLLALERAQPADSPS